MSTIAEQIEQRLQQEHSGAVAAAEQNGTLLLSGRVETAAERAAIERMARDQVGAMPIVNLIEVEHHVSDQPAGQLVDVENETEVDVTPVEDLGGPALDSLIDASLDAGFDGVPLDTSAIDAVGDEEYDDEDPPEEDPAYFAPTDPVIGARSDGSIEVLGGFAPTSLTGETVDPSAEDRIPGDEALADAVRRELREDASTTELALDVEVERGVVHLRGEVDDLEDAENAEAVASNVPGVRDVIDETNVRGL